MGETRAGGKEGAIKQETKGTDHRTRLGGERRELLLLLGVSARGISCGVLKGGGGTTVKAETIGLSGGLRQACKACVTGKTDKETGKTDKEPANSRTRDALCPSDIVRGEAGKALTLSSSSGGLVLTLKSWLREGEHTRQGSGEAKEAKM